MSREPAGPSGPPRDVFRLVRTPLGIELYFPPLRNPGSALTIAGFGVACFAPALLAGYIVWPGQDADAGGWVAFWLMSIFVFPLAAVGALLVMLGTYLLANSLTVTVTESAITATRRVLGVRLSQKRVERADVVAIEPEVSLRLRTLRGETPYYSLALTTKSGASLTMREACRTGRLAQFAKRKLIVAESLPGEPLAERVRASIVDTARLHDLVRE
ncbi:MAG: hypothetical protein HY323_00675 [Betaproteobacteria bacterium]|nr:hypothetical protein [Betaproteobacteria bacterium]